MLVITRRAGERIIIDDITIVEILEIAHNKVKIGVTAPKEISVYREENYRSIRGGGDDAITQGE